MLINFVRQTCKHLSTYKLLHVRYGHVVMLYQVTYTYSYHVVYSLVCMYLHTHSFIPTQNTSYIYNIFYSYFYQVALTCMFEFVFVIFLVLFIFVCFFFIIFVSNGITTQYLLLLSDKFYSYLCQYNIKIETCACIKKKY